MSEQTKEKRFQSVGFMTEKKTSKIISFNIPFLPKEEFFCIDNQDKKEESSPDFSLWLLGSRVGNMWKKKDKNGNLYYSGSLFCFFLPTSNLQFSIFQEEKGEEKVWTIKIPYIY